MIGKQKWVGFGLATVVGISAIAPLGEQVAFAKATASLPFNKEVVKEYSKVEPLVAKAEATKTVKDVAIAHKAFIEMSQLFILDDQRVYKEGNDMDKLYERVHALVYGLPKAEQKKHLPIMADKWVETVKNNTSTIMSFYLEDFLSTNKNKEVKNDFALSAKKLRLYQTLPPGSPLPSDWKKPIEEMIEDQEDTISKPVLDAPPSPPKVVVTAPDKSANTSTPSASTAVEFVQAGDFWYEVTVSYKNGIAVTTAKRKLTEKEAPHLYQSDLSSGNGAGSSTGVKDGEGVFFPELTDSEKAYLLEDQNEQSKYTVQYTLEKQGNAPYYFDTGLRVDEQMNVSYEQYRDVLYQIAVKSGGYVVEDDGRVLVVIDKKAIIVKDIKKDYSEKEIESLFESFPNIDIRILETRIGTSASLEQQLVTKQARTVTIAGEKVDLTTTPIVREERVLLPIKEIVEEMGAKVEQDGDQFIVKKDKVTVIYELKSTKVIVKGKETDIGIAPDVKNDILFVEMTELASAFNYEIVWDGDSSELAFNKID